MSIWSSVGTGDILALDGHDKAANYRAEGEPTIVVDVATAASWHDHVRLALYSTGYGAGGVDACAVLSPDAARNLRDRLTQALLAPDMSEAPPGIHTDGASP